VNKVVNLDKYKIFLPKANGVGTLGEILSSPILSLPGIGSTETFLSVGSFDTAEEATSTLKYIKTKFARALLGILKTTQDITPEKWKYVPLQDFTPASDIDWSKSIPEIDQQLYAKYGLDENEITFIETHVKEMT
jgi:type II restriction enzyme